VQWDESVDRILTGKMGAGHGRCPMRTGENIPCGCVSRKCVGVSCKCVLSDGFSIMMANVDSWDVWPRGVGVAVGAGRPPAERALGARVWLCALQLHPPCAPPDAEHTDTDYGDPTQIILAYADRRLSYNVNERISPAQTAGAASSSATADRRP
jgi:hypothetical protein